MLSKKEVNICCQVEDKIELDDRIISITSWSSEYDIDTGNYVRVDIKGHITPKVKKYQQKTKRQTGRTYNMLKAVNDLQGQTRVVICLNNIQVNAIQKMYNEIYGVDKLVTFCSSDCYDDDIITKILKNSDNLYDNFFIDHLVIETKFKHVLDSLTKYETYNNNEQYLQTR